MILKLGMAALARLRPLWRYLGADLTRTAFAVLIALCGFLALRLAMIDGDRDRWRDRAQAYEAASRALKDANRAAAAEARDVAEGMKGEIDAGNQRAADAARDSDDPLKSGLDSLRSQAAGGRGQAAR